ncbi:hypothetical protein QZH41_000091 [Actinostola sp. cb2023]|nr:hypothetical protein QZH41_000091 [Actinostola sp. cb2023]
MHENEKKRMYSKRVMEIEQGTFTPLVFTTTGGMGNECLRYNSRLAELIAIKKAHHDPEIKIHTFVVGIRIVVITTIFVVTCPSAEARWDFLWCNVYGFRGQNGNSG